MKAIVVLFDTLNRRYLPSYGADWTHMPNFERLAEASVTFDTCYGGSMPCMPARRELHTGRYNFLHRSWGPLEPFDDSVPELLGRAGTYTHLVTDHQHYWEDGGATYHNRFSTYEFFRGQEGDRWKGVVADPEIPETITWRTHSTWRQDWVNRQYMQRIEDHPQTKTIDAGIEFIETNSQDDNWLLQIECFDPHEPFMSYEEHKQHYIHDYNGPHFDWPDYRRTLEDASTIEHARMEYAALLTMCDASLGRVLDVMDEKNLWDETMLIVMTDHGLLLGEHGWWGKMVQPWYDENIHTPLFVWDPRNPAQGQRRKALVQTIDIAPTLLSLFDVPVPADMQGKDLSKVLRDDSPIREAGLFGSFGAHVNVTDGRYVYMRSCATPRNEPLFEHTLMPTHMDNRFHPAEFNGVELVDPFTFTKGTPVLRMPGRAVGNPYAFGCLLFDLESDPEQLNPLIDDQLELRMMTLLVSLMLANDAPPSQYERLGLPFEGLPNESHLQISKSWPRIAESALLPEPAEAFETPQPGVLWELRSLMAYQATAEVVLARLPFLSDPNVMHRFEGMSPWQLSTILPSINRSDLRLLHEELGACPVGTTDPQTSGGVTGARDACEEALRIDG